MFIMLPSFQKDSRVLDLPGDTKPKITAKSLGTQTSVFKGKFINVDLINKIEGDYGVSFSLWHV